jgi:drug/metabolite transporter (DMT)-like permease
MGFLSQKALALDQCFEWAGMLYLFFRYNYSEFFETTALSESGGIEMDDKKSNQLVLIAFIVSTILGGHNAIAVRFSNLELPPFFGAAIRFLAAAVILLILVLIRRLEIPTGRSLVGVIVFGVLQFGFSYALIYWSLLELQAGQFQVIFALVPLLTYVFAMLHKQERFHWRAVIGGLLAVGGIAIIFRDSLTADVSLLPLLAGVLAAACVAEAAVLFKTFPKSHPVTTNALAMAVGAAILFAGSWISHEPINWPTQTNTWIALFYLVVFGSVGTFVMVLYVLKRWTASATSYALVIMPIVTIISSALITDEPITPALMLGGVFVMGGVYLSVLAPPDLFKKN